MKKTKTSKKNKSDAYIICRHCHKRILKTKLIGFSLICPNCNKPGNGLSHKLLSSKKSTKRRTAKSPGGKGMVKNRAAKRDIMRT